MIQLNRLVALVILTLATTSASNAQQIAPQPAAAPAAPGPADTKLDYPDSTAGLEHLIKDIMKAQKNIDIVHTEPLLKSLILPEPRQWYERVFGPTIARNEGAVYEQTAASVPTTIANSLLQAAQLPPDRVEAHRFDRSCDDDAGEYTFGVLHARLEPVPIYEVRFVRGDKLFRLFSFAFVDGSFRFIIAPKLEGPVFPGPRRPSSAKSEAPPATDPSEAAGRVKMGGIVQAARLVRKLPPSYPDLARRERLEGTVKLHALIARDGSVQNLYVIRGYCSLAQASIDAVKKWKYTPTMLLGSPVEVDTEIDVIYQLQF